MTEQPLDHSLVLDAAYRLLRMAEQIDGEWGSGRDVNLMRADGDPDVLLADRLLASVPDESELLDPEPWASRWARSQTAREDYTFSPRRGYSQNREDYA